MDIGKASVRPRHPHPLASIFSALVFTNSLIGPAIIEVYTPSNLFQL